MRIRRLVGELDVVMHQGTQSVDILKNHEVLISFAPARDSLLILNTGWIMEHVESNAAEKHCHGS